MLGSWVRIPTSAFPARSWQRPFPVREPPMTPRTRWLLGLVLFLGLAFPASAQQPIRKFRAGAYAQDITPTKFPISVNGGMADRQATKARDRLHARCLVLDDGSTTIAIVVCDSCMIPREVTDPAKRLVEKAIGLPPERILISAT